jgi:glycine/D-amino acid oxidase-like deaminating enzyme
MPTPQSKSGWILRLFLVLGNLNHPGYSVILLPAFPCLTTMTATTDIVIFGGGIAGLWLLERLRSSGYHAILLEPYALGAGQSIASQGMIHGGMKYALGGTLTGAAKAIADMPQQWRLCLEGKGDVDLRGTRLLSDTYYLWPRNSLRSRFNAFLGSKAVQGRVDALVETEFPAFLRGHVRGPLYRLQDIVLDVPSLLQTLAERNRAYIHGIDWHTSQLERAPDGSIRALHLHDGRSIIAQRYISTSGEGTEFFLESLQEQSVVMQKRPLHMVIVKHRLPDPLYVHCVSGQVTTTPELTITTHPCKDGSSAWYLGGELAESGVARSAEEQVQHTRKLLRELFPWCDLSQASFHCFRVNRAEARQPGGKRPDQASLLEANNMFYCWPTKLTLAPTLANAVLGTLQTQGVLPSSGSQQALAGLASPPLAITPWDAC